jgi:hypothetical protein
VTAAFPAGADFAAAVPLAPGGLFFLIGGSFRFGGCDGWPSFVGSAESGGSAVRGVLTAELAAVEVGRSSILRLGFAFGRVAGRVAAGEVEGSAAGGGSLRSSFIRISSFSSGFFPFPPRPPPRPPPLPLPPPRPAPLPRPPLVAFDGFSSSRKSSSSEASRSASSSVTTSSARSSSDSSS